MAVAIDLTNMLRRMKARNNRPLHFIETLGANCISMLAICCAAFCDLMPDFLYCPCLCCSDEIDDLSQNSIVDNCISSIQTSQKSISMSQISTKDSTIVTSSPKGIENSSIISPQSLRIPVMPLTPSEILMFQPFSSTQTIITDSPYTTPPHISALNLNERKKKELQKQLENRHIRLKRILREPVLFSSDQYNKSQRGRNHKRLKRYTPILK